MMEEAMKNASFALSGGISDDDRIRALIDELAQELRQKKIVIYPAGYLGQLLSRTLAEHGMAAEFYIDRSADKTKTIGGTPVRDPRVLSELSEDWVVFIASNWDDLVRQLSGTARRYNGHIPILDGFEANRIFRYPACFRKLQEGASFDLIECENCGFERHDCSLCLTYLKRLAGATACEDDWRSKSFTWFGYIVGQVCTLKCVHCCEAIPFLKEHRFVPKDVILQDVRRVAASSRFLTFVELVGGEPFLHPDFHDLVRELLQIKNIGYIKSFTNGTIVPDMELCQTLKDPRFMLQVSNYEMQATGKLYDNIMATRKVLNEQGVNYIFTPNFEWQDFTSFAFHNTDDKLESVFRNCTLRNCNRLYNGVLYRCPHQYAGTELGMLERHEVECVDIKGHDDRGLAEAIEAFENVPYIDACRYCLMPFDAPPVPAGIQLNGGSD